MQADLNAARATQLAEKANQAQAAALQEKAVALGMAYSASMLAASDALDNGKIDMARHYLDNTPADPRGWEWRVLSNRLTMAFSADSRWLATGSFDNTIRITDVSTNPPVAKATLRGHTDWVSGLSFSPDGSLLASSGHDQTLRVWDTRTGLCNAVFKSDGDCPCFLPDGRTLINGDSDGVRFWDVQSLDALDLRGHSSYVYSVFISPDGGTIYSGGWDGFVGQPGSVRFWDAATGELIGAAGVAGEYCRAAALSLDGSRLAVSIAHLIRSPGRIDILDTATGMTALTITNLGANRVASFIDSLALCADISQGIMHIIDAHTGVTRKSRRVSSPGPKEYFFAWSPDGATIALAIHGETNIVILDGRSLKPLRQWPHGHKGWIDSVSFSADSADS
ncbi:MAG TPA: hypothetical protein VH595_16790 [Verrucomicrobiae bacterium]|jgi:WD40 repeat protein|nr:hypothetical protein [Verrucomicrobiae bacterium]